MPFGKFRGWPIDELPDKYLWWLLGLPDLHAPLQSALCDEADRRDRGAEDRRHVKKRAPRTDIVDELVGAGLRGLAKRYHPDLVGGDGEKMKSLNTAADWLKAQVRSIA